MLLLTDPFTNAWTLFTPYVFNIIKAIVVIYIGRKVIKLIEMLIERASERAEVDQGLISFITSLSNIVLYIILIVVIASIFGVPTATFITIIGSCGLAVGLALQGSLQNFAGGVLILFLKPFIVGDYIIVNNLEGTVTSIDICYTKLLTIDNKVVILPNGALSNSNLVNVSKEKYRRIDLLIPISYTDDIIGIKYILEDVAGSQHRVLKDRQIDIYVDSYANDCIQIGFRVWCKSSDYWPLRWALLEAVKLAMDENGYTIPFRQMDVFIKNQK